MQPPLARLLHFILPNVVDDRNQLRLQSSHALNEAPRKSQGQQRKGHKVETFADELAAKHRHDHASEVAYSAMCAGLPMHPVDRTHSGETLADMLSMHTTNYRTDIDGANPVDLLCAMLAEGLRSTDPRVRPAAEAFAKRIQADYVLSREEVTA